MSWDGVSRFLGAIAIASAVLLPPFPRVGAASAALTAADVAAISRAATTALNDPTLTVAIVDRRGQILSLYARSGAGGTTPDLAVSLARTAAFFSNDHAPLSSRTVRFISGIHFPPDIPNTANAPLYGIENTNRGCSAGTQESTFTALPRPRSWQAEMAALPCNASDTRGCSLGITTGKSSLRDADGFNNTVNPGGTPLYRGGILVGGIGVAGTLPDRADFAALTGAAGNGVGVVPAETFPDELPMPGAVFIDGIRLPFFRSCLSVQCVRDTLAGQRPAGSSPGSENNSGYLVAPLAGQPAPEQYLLGPRASSQTPGLSGDDVGRIVNQAVAAANATRAVIRLPSGQTAKMVITVSDQSGEFLAIYRMPDAPIFSVDAAMEKARNAYYFSTREGYEVLRGYVTSNPYDHYSWEPEPPAGQGWATTNRTLSYGGQPLFPPGIDLTKAPTPGPWFDLFVYDTRNPCTEGSGASRGGDRSFENQSGVAWFPGSAPLYQAGALVGGLGISGDGVEQDDYVSAGGAAGFEPPPQLRVDQSFIKTGVGDAVRLPYAQFPRNPSQP